ncbi:MAG: phosphate acetyltransferase [Cyclobacteriaceae bacterium]
MPSSIYITTAEARCGKSLICLGILEYALRKTRKVSIFRPIITSDSPNKRDKNIELLLTHFQLDQKYEEAYAFHQKEAEDFISNGDSDLLLDRIIDKYKALEAKSDFILCEGSDFLSESSAFEFGFNMQIAKNLRSPVLIVGRGDLKRSVKEVMSPLKLALESSHEYDCEVVGAIINRANPESAEELEEAMKGITSNDNLFSSVIPENELLKSPTVREVADFLNATVLFGEDHLDNQIFRYSIAAMQLQNYLPKLSENCMVITPGDRGEIIIGGLQAHTSQNYPKIAAILLTAGLRPESSILKLLEGLTHTVPILSVESNTYETSTQLDHLHSYVTPHNKAKIAESLNIFEKHVNLELLQKKTDGLKARGMTPRMFQYQLLQKAKQNRKHIVLPEGEDERILRAAEILVKQRIVQLTILGVKERVEKLINKYGLNMDPDLVSIIEPQFAPKYQEYVTTFYELRKHKGLSLDMAHDIINDVSYFGTMMVYMGDADGMVSGAVHTTQHTIRPALQLIKTKPGFSIASSTFFMCLEDRVLVYGDCAINPNPNAQELAEISTASAQTADAFGIEPKIAMLSYSSGESGKGADVEKVREATKIVKSKNLGFKIEGPIQYDAAVDVRVGQQKIPGSEVAGHATVLIFPDLNTGNNTYKAVQRETGAIAIGPVLQGLNKPVNDLSRGCTVTDIVNTVTITAIQSQSN